MPGQILRPSARRRSPRRAVRSPRPRRPDERQRGLGRARPCPSRSSGPPSRNVACFQTKLGDVAGGEEAAGASPRAKWKMLAPCIIGVVDVEERGGGRVHRQLELVADLRSAAEASPATLEAVSGSSAGDLPVIRSRAVARNVGEVGGRCSVLAAGSSHALTLAYRRRRGSAEWRSCARIGDMPDTTRVRNLADLVQRRRRRDRTIRRWSPGTARPVASWTTPSPRSPPVRSARARGRGPGGVALGNGPAFVASYFGALRAGLVVVPLNTGYTRPS